MTKARSTQISMADTPYYHCISRCVRRAYKSNVELLCLNGELKDKNINRKEQTLFRAKGYISDKEPKIISKLGIDTEVWLDTVKEYSESYHAFVGSEKQSNALLQFYFLGDLLIHAKSHLNTF